MKQVMIYKGKAYLRDVPDPCCNPNGILVETSFSCISAGTESTSIKGSRESLFHKAITRPATAVRFGKMIITKGPRYVINMIKTKTSFGYGNPIGYSASGVVKQVGSKVSGFTVGDRVAIYGSKYAYHASYNLTTPNMAVKIPHGISLEDASTGALGGIAMQGVHRLAPKAGDVVLVVGIGLIGYIVTQILLAYNCKVICSDIVPERLSVCGLDDRVKIVKGNEKEFAEKVKMLNSGDEVDGAIFTASTSSSEALSNCFKALRKKGKCVLVGVSGMLIDRNTLYEKELDFLISTSYGPGRYDTEYEDKGRDYPEYLIPFTEQRNIEEYLRLLSEHKINLSILSRRIYKAANCSTAFGDVIGKKASMIELLDYSDCHSEEIHKIVRKKTKPQKGVIQVGIVGTGSYAKSMHLPNLHNLPSMYKIRAIMNRSGVSAAALSEQYDADYSTNDYSDVINDPDIDLVVICTRHDSHADLAMRALREGKHVLVEKPPALNEAELTSLLEVVNDVDGMFTVGYNRRFSKCAKEIKQQLEKRKGSVFLRYLMNAGYIPYDSWVHNEGGGRIIGEGCHIVDLIVFLLGIEIESISTEKMGSNKGYYRESDNVISTITFKDGSIAVFEYISTGSTLYPKETMDIFFDGKHISLSDYNELIGDCRHIKNEEQDKGQLDMLKDIYSSLNNEDTEIIPVSEIGMTSRLTFCINLGENKSL